MPHKELLFSALKNKNTCRNPWVPFVGCHGGSLIGKSAASYLQDEDLIVRGVSRAVELYKPDGIPVLFDLQIEAQTLGCELEWDPENPPSVISHPLKNDQNLTDLALPEKSAGRFPLVLSAMERLNEKFGSEIALYGLVTGPFTLALHLMGSEIFLQMHDQKNEVKQIIDFCKEVALQTAEWYLEAGMDVIAVVDPMTSQISPADFTSFVQPYASEIFEFIAEKNAYSSFFVCGDARQNIEQMCLCGPDNISFDENIPLQYVLDIASEHEISLGGNLKLTTILLNGTPEMCKQHVLESMEEGGTKGYIVSPGCDLPYSTPPENLQAAAEVIHNREAYSLLDDFENIEDQNELSVTLPDYKKDSRVFVEVFTLDSKSCAPCQYMVDTVINSIDEELQDKIVFKEYKIKDKESVVRMKKMEVTSIPSIVIEGRIKYENTPSQKELHSTIVKLIKEKN